MNTQGKAWLMRGGVLLALCVVAWMSWTEYSKDVWGKGLASGNGRIEAVEIDIASKAAGRLRDVLVREGDFVSAGQVVALMDTEVLDAQLRQAEAQLQQAQIGVTVARSQWHQRRAEKTAMLAVQAQREAEFDIARKRQSRSSTLAKTGASSQQVADEDRAQVLGASAAVSAAKAQVVAADGAIATAEAQVASAASAVDAARASVARVRADIDDSTLKAPRDGRIQYRVAQAGEVVGAGGRVLNMVDLSDVYMTFFLPTASAGKLALGDEVRLVLDAAPQFVVPARVSFVADVAQFTPKTVETAVEREKLMFRVRAQLPSELLKKHILHVKTGLPGMAYVRLDSNTPWPERLALKLP